MIREDIDLPLTEFGVPCTFGRTSFVGLIDAPDRDFDFGSTGVRTVDHLLTFKTGAVELHDGDVIYVDVQDDGLPTPFKVRSPRRVDDGKLTEVGLLP